jgi:REP element-mobilizing transposase RayT
MPDHQHLIISGRQEDSDIWSAIVKYKQKTGFWLPNNTSLKWQKDFYDHMMRSDEDIVTQVKYILDNPVRKGLVKSWEEYPFKGSIGCRLEDVLNGIM